MKKLLPMILVAIVVIGGSLYFFVFRDPGEKPDVRVVYSPGEFFTTNVNGAPRLLKTAVVLIVNKEGLDDMLTAENARIRDTIIFILRDLTEPEILDLGTQDMLRERILTALNERLETGVFIEVLFNDFVMA
ncbi:MAG: flagellar basal body-associated FliL family protein [Oscillospiraceae bacterium]|nr:flagellar basal body-associated FliL family protein [Oscillospiraceae bacterium]